MPVPISDAQLGLWLTERVFGAHPAHHVALGVWLDGPRDDDALERACRRVVSRHVVLRCAVVEREGAPCLHEMFDAGSDGGDVLRGPLVLGDVERHLREPFDLANGPLVRFRILVRSPRRALLLVVAHHLVLDGGSKDVLLADLAAAYTDLVAPDDADRGAGAGSEDTAGMRSEDTACPVPSSPQPLDLATLEAARGYWNRIGHTSGHVLLPGLRRVPDGPGDGACVSVAIPTALSDRVREAATGWGASTYEVLVAAVHALLVRYGSDDPVLTLPLSTRPRTDDAARHIGLDVNELPFRSPAPTGGLRDHARAVRAALRELYRYRHVPLGRAVSGLRPTTAWSPVVLGYRRPAPPPVFPGLTIDVQWIVPTGASRASLEIQVVDLGPGTPLDVLVRHRLDGLDGDDAARIGGHLVELLDAGTAAPTVPLAELPLLPPAERAAALDAATGPVRPQLPTRTVLQLLATTVAARPDATAVVDGDRTWTYRRLAGTVSIVAASLRRIGVAPGDRVAVELPRSASALAVLLGVLSCGAAYVPIDPAHPAARRQLILEDCAPRLVVVAPGAARDERPEPVPGLLQVPVTELVPIAELVPPTPGAGAPADRPDDVAAPDAVVAPDSVAAPGDVAYVMYTSGSTGRPKGVAVSHGALANLLGGMAETVGAEPRHRWLQLTTLSFDISGLELYLPLVTGGTVVVASAVTGADGGAVLRLIRSAGATHVQATPSQWRILLDAGLGAQGREPLVALAGGEALPLPVAVELRSRVTRLLNVYGPTETTIWSTADDVPAAVDDVTIGCPIANTRAYVVDEHTRMLPDGVPGGLAIGGAGVAVGYLGRPDLTERRFVPDPCGPPGSRMYLTGDRCVRLSDGRLRFLGRGDGQVKIRGHRVELGEIENRLLTHPAVDDVAVVLHGEGPAQQLVAYLTTGNTTAGNTTAGDTAANGTTAGGTTTGHLITGDSPSAAAAQLRAYVAAALPAVMVPTRWEFTDALPHTPNGKLDRTALAERPLPPRGPVGATEVADADITDAAPSGAPDDGPPDLIASLRALWSEVLKVPDVGIDEDLFDLGGHSLTIARLSGRIHQQFGVEIPLDVFFDAPTIREIAAVVAAGGEVTTCLI